MNHLTLNILSQSISLLYCRLEQQQTRLSALYAHGAPRQSPAFYRCYYQTEQLARQIRNLQMQFHRGMKLLGCA